MSLRLASERVVLPDGVRPAAVRVEDGAIVAIDTPGPDDELLDAVIMPGLVDTHVHVNEPGRTEWEGFETATRAAAAGGITTIVDMPLNASPVTTTVAALETKRVAADGKCHVDCGFWGGVIPGNVGDLEPLLDAGVLGFKCFMTPSGIDEFPHVGTDDLEAAAPVLAGRGTVLLAHAERGLKPATGPMTRYRDYLESRPPWTEAAAIDALVGLGMRHPLRVHVVHLSSTEPLELLRISRRRGLRITVETCPHYLAFAAESIADGATVFKCAPPIRDERNRERLWQALAEGDIDLVASDHSPCPPALKRLDEGDFHAAWGGIASLQLGLSIMITHATPRGFGLDDVARWMSTAPARLAGLARKGRIEVGADADLVVVNPDASFVVDPARLEHRHPITPYTGSTLRGVVQRTYLRGQLVHDGGAFPLPPTGRLVS